MIDCSEHPDCGPCSNKLLDMRYFSLAFGSMMVINGHGSQECVNWNINNHGRKVTIVYEVIWVI
jgi:hypothetical protein